MKKIFIIITILLVALLSSDITTGGILPRDRNGTAIQIARTIRMYDDDNDVLDHMYNGTFADTTRWDLTDSLSISGGGLVYTETDTSATASTATMDADSMSVAIRNAQSLIFYYDVTIDSAVVGGTVIAWIDGICDSTALSLVAGTDKSVSITTVAAATDSNFVFHIKPDTLVTRADFTFDNFELRGYYESPITLATTASATITVPDNAISIVIDSAAADIEIVIGSAYFIVDEMITLPVDKIDTVTITDVSGGSVISYYFNMLK